MVQNVHDKWWRDLNKQNKVFWVLNQTEAFVERTGTVTSEIVLPFTLPAYIDGFYVN